MTDDELIEKIAGSVVAHFEALEPSGKGCFDVFHRWKGAVYVDGEFSHHDLAIDIITALREAGYEVRRKG